jgi:probable rRNA maturation factor
VSAKVEVALQPGSEKARGPVRDLVEAILASERALGRVSVAFVDEPEMTRLNALYRGLDSSTDVLSFGQGEGGADWPDPTKSKTPDLGEIVVCPEVVHRYALEDDGDPDTQMGWTIIHGTLHLLGLDHEADNGEMRTRERALLGSLDRQVRALSTALRG